MIWQNLPRIALALTMLVAAAIAVGTLTPHDAMPAPPPGTDKLHHFLAFAALVFPATAARPRIALWLVPVAIAYGGAIELIQPSVGRSAEWADFMANGLGASTGALAGWGVHRRLLRPRATQDATRRPGKSPSQPSG
jgi:VanZ family protein